MFQLLQHSQYLSHISQISSTLSGLLEVINILIDFLGREGNMNGQVTKEEPHNTSNLPRGWYLPCRLSQRKRPSTKPVKITWLPFGRWESRYRRACITLESISLGVVMWASVSRSLKKRTPIGFCIRNTVSPKGHPKLSFSLFASLPH